MLEILRQEYLVSNPFDEKMAIEALKAQLSSLIFKELIDGEKKALKITFTIEVEE